MGVEGKDADISPDAVQVSHEATDQISQSEKGVLGEGQTQHVELRRALKARHITMIGMSISQSMLVINNGSDWRCHWYWLGTLLPEMLGHLV